MNKEVASSGEGAQCMACGATLVAYAPLYERIRSNPVRAFRMSVLVGASANQAASSSSFR